VFTSEDRGRWVQFRFHAKAGTVAGKDGQYQVWKDGMLIADLPADWVTAEGEGYDYYRKGYLFGWSNSGFDEETVFYLDEFKYYASDPGW
jgi:hypothetical protein